MEAQSAVEPFWVIECFDVIEDQQSGVSVAVRFGFAEAFGFEGGEEGFGQGVVVAVALAAHAGLHVQGLQQ